MNLKKNMIPKKIYFFWGNEKMSWMRYMTLKSFRIFHPDWEITLYLAQINNTTKPWTDSLNYQDYFNFIGEDYFYMIKDLSIDIKIWNMSDNGIIEINNYDQMGASHMSNFFKWSKLATDGGIYSDMDIIYFKPIDYVYNEFKEYTTILCQTSYLSIGFLASAGDDIFFKDIFINGLTSYYPGSYQSAGVENIYNLYSQVDEKDEIKRMIEDKYPTLRLYNIIINCPQSAVLNIAQSKYPNLKFYNLNFNFVYPRNVNETVESFRSNLHIKDLPDNSCGFHWYGGHYISQNYNNILTEKNYKNFNSLFTNIAKEILQ